MPLHPIQDAGVHRSASVVSMAASDTTYHSFHDLDVYQPASVRGPAQPRPAMWGESAFEPTPMRRQDSGYESIPSGSVSGSSRESARRASTASSHSAQVRARTRPSIRRASRSSPVAHGYQHQSRTSGHSMSRSRSQQQATAYFHFPSPDGALSEDEGLHDVGPAFPPPPQTTHYWTSDYTRRLEYAAIDAARTGVKGWILRHVVPDCFVPKSTRRVGFDDDTGSVRRYRLELECEEAAEKANGRKKMGWLRGR